MFSRIKHSIKAKCYVLGKYNLKNKVCFVYLQRKLRQDSYGWSILKVKIPENIFRDEE